MAKKKTAGDQTDLSLEHIHESIRHLAVPVYDVQPDPANARAHDRASIEAIKRSLKEFGQDQVVVVRRETKTCVKGSGRLVAARELMWTHVAVAWVDDDELLAVARGLADNRSSELSRWDTQALARSLERLRAAGTDTPLDALGWSPDEIERLAGFSTAFLDGSRGGESSPPSSQGAADKGEAAAETVTAVFPMPVAARDELMAYLGSIKQRHGLSTAAEALLRVVREHKERVA